MELPECLFISNKDLPGGELLLRTRPPYRIARAYKFEDERAMENFIIKNNLLGSCCITTGFRILICYVGTIEGINENPALVSTVTTDFLTTLNTLTTFYEKNRIKGNETRFKKFAR